MISDEHVEAMETGQREERADDEPGSEPGGGLRLTPW
jgi:hypothetical protein